MVSPHVLNTSLADHGYKTLWPSDNIWWQRTGSPLTHVTAFSFQHQVITWPDVYISPIVFCSIYLGLHFHKRCLRYKSMKIGSDITLFKSLSHFTEASELMKPWWQYFGHKLNQDTQLSDGKAKQSNQVCFIFCLIITHWVYISNWLHMLYRSITVMMDLYWEMCRINLIKVFLSYPLY